MMDIGATEVPKDADSVSANGAGAGRATLAAFAARGRSIASNVNFKFVMVCLYKNIIPQSREVWPWRSVENVERENGNVAD